MTVVNFFTSTSTSQFFVVAAVTCWCLYHCHPDCEFQTVLIKDYLFSVKTDCIYLRIKYRRWMLKSVWFKFKKHEHTHKPKNQQWKQKRQIQWRACFWGRRTEPLLMRSTCRKTGWLSLSCRNSKTNRKVIKDGMKSVRYHSCCLHQQLLSLI